MPLAALAVLLFWDQPTTTADTLRKAGIERLFVPAGREEAWRKLGFEAIGFDPAHATRATVPKVEYHMDVASATRVPWIEANGWRFERHPALTYFYDVPAAAAALAAAEAYAYGVTAAIRTPAEGVPNLARMLHNFAQIDAPRLTSKANIGVIDDGSEELGEILNLMARHNLLFHVNPAPDSKYDLTIRTYSKEDAANPYAFAMKIRRQLGDDKRLLRLYGSNLVLARLTGDAAHARVDLLNYGQSPVRGLRIRVLGEYRRGALADYAVADGATEFTIPELQTYSVILLNRL